jgi:ABC-type sugar transport system ATPase subunit
LVSSELSEILALSDRILVMTGGQLVYGTTPSATDERTLGLWMTGRATLIDSPLLDSPLPPAPLKADGPESPRA